MKYDVFISYRRVDSEGNTSGRDIARTIKLELEKRKYKVFFDYSEIKDNEFEDVILSAVKESKFFLLVLSKDALLRCSNERDWVRREIETALSNGCKIIPVNPDNSFEGWPENLPETLYPMTKRQISEISMGALFEKSIDKLVEERILSSSHKEDLSIDDLKKGLSVLSGWLTKICATIKTTWNNRNIWTNVLLCFLLLLLLPFLFIFCETLRKHFCDFLDLSIGYYAVSLTYCILQLFVNRRDGLYIMLFCPIVVIPVGWFFFDVNNNYLIGSTILMYLYSVFLVVPLCFKKNGKTAWKQMRGGVFDFWNFKRHFLFYLWCIIWIILAYCKTR